MIDLWQREGKAIRGDTALTLSLQCDRLYVERLDKGNVARHPDT